MPATQHKKKTTQSRIARRRAEIAANAFTARRECQAGKTQHGTVDDFLKAQHDDVDDWDRQMAADVEAGKLDPLIAEADAEYRAGKTVPLEFVGHKLK